MNRVVFVEVEDGSGMALEQMDHLALVAFVDGPEDLVAGMKRAPIKVDELRRDRKRGTVGVPGEAGEGKREVTLRMRDDIAIGRDVAGEPKNRLAVGREGIAGLVRHVVIKVELNGLAGGEALPIVIVELTNHT